MCIYKVFTGAYLAYLGVNRRVSLASLAGQGFPTEVPPWSGRVVTSMACFGVISVQIGVYQTIPGVVVPHSETGRELAGRRRPNLAHRRHRWA